MPRILTWLLCFLAGCLVTLPGSTYARAALEPQDGLSTDAVGLPWLGEIAAPAEVQDDPPAADVLGMEVGPNLYAYVRCNPWSKFDAHGLYLLPVDKTTRQILTNVRQADKRLEQIVMELEKSPYPFEISASMGDGKTYKHKGEFSPGKLNPAGTGIADERLFKSDDRYNGKGMGGRILTTSIKTEDGKTPEETMAHELGHAFDANRGISPTVSKEKRGIVGSAKLPLSKLADVDENENRAVRTENIYNEAKGNKIRDKYPVSRDNDRSKEEVPNPQGKHAPVSTERLEDAPHLRKKP